MRTPRYFFYHGDLCKRLNINRGADVVTCWNYPKHRMEKYVFSDVLRNGERAWSTAEVTKLINRQRWAIATAYEDGHIERPQNTYGIETGEFFAYKWSEKDILALHEYFTTVHWGRPPKDGHITPKALPTRSELRAMLHNGTVTYVKDENDNFVPTWQAIL